MAANSAALAQALCNVADRGMLDLDELQAQCVAKLLEGGGEISFVLTAGLNGKTAGQECRKDAGELLVIVEQALGLSPTTGPVVTCTYVDFSGLR